MSIKYRKLLQCSDHGLKSLLLKKQTLHTDVSIIIGYISNFEIIKPSLFEELENWCLNISADLFLKLLICYCVTRVPKDPMEG